jgi:hypothetical protein
LVKELSGASRKLRRPRSQLLEDALRLWRRSRLGEELKAGYLAIAAEDRRVAEKHLAAAWEVLK